MNNSKKLSLFRVDSSGIGLTDILANSVVLSTKQMKRIIGGGTIQQPNGGKPLYTKRCTLQDAFGHIWYSDYICVSYGHCIVNHPGDCLPCWRDLQCDQQLGW